MKKLSILLFIFATFLVTYKSFAQQKPVYSQYMFNQLVINPAYAGNQKVLSIVMDYRNQWVNVPGAPKVSTFTAHSAAKKKPIGAGFSITNDQIGVHNDLSFYGYYAYQINFPGAKLALGISAGFNDIRSNYDKVNKYTTGDVYLSGQASSFSPNFGTGAFFYTENAYIGVSIPYLLNSNFVPTTGEGKFIDLKKARYYFVTAGKVFDATFDGNVKIKPSVLLRVQERMPIGFDINCSFIIHDRVILGGSYRSGEAFVTLFQLQTNENFRFGYAYDYVLNGLNTHTGGSHEFLVNYTLPWNKGHCKTYDF